MPTYGVSVTPSSIPPWAVNQRIGTAAGRYALNTMLMPRTDSGLTYTDYRSGVMASGDGGSTHLAMQVTPGSSGMRVTVAQGNAVVNTSNQGAYMCCLDAAKTLTLNAASGTTNRYDLIVARVYDDNNSALAGSAGVRQFTVEAVQGDSSQSTATVPSAPAGAIPLASVSVAKNTSSISAAMITDLRGPGLVSRGGMRSLYGNESTTSSTEFARAGAYPGDQRWVHNNGFQHQVYYGNPPDGDPTRGGWRGVFNCMVFNASPPTTNNWIWAGFPPAGPLEWCRVHIPYPGTPFMLYPSARVHAQVSDLTAVEIMATLNSANGTIMSWSGLDIGQSLANTTQTLNLAPIMWGPFTSAQDVLLCGHAVQTTRPGGGTIAAHGSQRTVLSVCVFPSTIAPPGASDTSGGNTQSPGIT